MNSFCSINSSKLAFTLPSKKKSGKKKLAFHFIMVSVFGHCLDDNIKSFLRKGCLLHYYYEYLMPTTKLKKRDAIDYTEDRYDNPLVKKESPSKKEKKANKLQIVSPNYYFLVGLLFCFTFFFV